MAKRNIGVLPMNETYTALSVDHLDDEVLCQQCENCGRHIVNVVTLENSKGNKFLVWTDCAETLGMAEFSNFLEYQDQKRSLNRYLRALKTVSKIAELPHTILNSPDMGYYIYPWAGQTKWSASYQICDRNVSRDRRQDFRNALEKKYGTEIVLETK